MGLGDNLVSTAVTEAFEQSGLEPGELNSKIDDVMETMETANGQLEDADEFQEKIRGDIRELNDAATTLADASATLAEASMSISESADNMAGSIDNNTQKINDLQEDVNELEDSLDKVSSFIEENTE